MILPHTGERLTTDVHDKTMVEHLHRYSVALEYVQDKIVLDIASGEGYGTDILSTRAKFVNGVDNSEEAIKHAQLKYNRHNTNFIKGYAHEIPLENESIDVVVSFETIEHHDKHQEMIKECKRVLKKDGVLIISSPDKKLYADIPNYKNPFHVKELYEEEFRALIATYFTNVHLLKQGVVRGSLIYSRDAVPLVLYSGDYENLHQEGDINYQYNLVIASNRDLSFPKNSFFESDLVNAELIEERNRYKKKYLTIYNSKYYKVGKVLLKPLLFLKKIIKK
jgi:ubiquinone/menaquinone biosynthesis C-methylase UbiE